MTNVDAIEKIMHIADKYAQASADVELNMERGSSDQIEQAERYTERVRTKLEQLVEDTILTLTKGGE